jgi:hypothetical protein
VKRSSVKPGDREVQAVRFSPDEWADIETAAKMNASPARSYVRIAAVKAARAEILKAGKKPATG